MASDKIHEDSAVRAAGRFTATHWSVVLAAGKDGSPERRAALEALCRTYWLPVYSYIRGKGHDVPDAKDLAQAFFAHLLTSSLLRRARPDIGRFRCLLVVSLKRFLINDAKRARAVKRGGNEFFISLDEIRAEKLRLRDSSGADNAEAAFDRQWALTVLDHAFERLREEWTRRGKADHFERLKVFLSSEGAASDYAAAGEALGIKPKTVPVTLHRLRRRYGDLIREEIAQTVSTAAEVDEEVRYLLELLGGS